MFLKIFSGNHSVTRSAYMSRWKASAIHLFVSALIISALGLLLVLTCYPPVYAWAMGGLGLIAILAGVDVCLGPLLTLIVWNPKKPSLRFDMAMIVLLQMLALSYGVYTIFLARPVFMVFAVDRFDLVTAADIPVSELEKVKRQEFKSLPLAGPEIVAARPPTDITERNRILFSAAVGGVDLPQMPQYYAPYPEMAAEVVRKASSIDPLMQRDAEARDKVSVYLEEHKLDPARVKFLPLRAKARDQTVLLDSATGTVLDIINIDPWL
ncbi:TfpX/TfpZ family type IV pilin accessory protein [Methylocaldum sp. MU1018]